jgi:hypothetical protein
LFFWTRPLLEPQTCKRSDRNIVRPAPLCSRWSALRGSAIHRPSTCLARSKDVLPAGRFYANKCVKSRQDRPSQCMCCTPGGRRPQRQRCAGGHVVVRASYCPGVICACAVHQERNVQRREHDALYSECMQTMEDMRALVAFPPPGPTTIVQR